MYNKNVYKYDDMKRKEHMAVRTTAGWYFWTHQLIEVAGEDAEKFLEYLFPNAIGSLHVGRERYTVMLDEKGEIIDDVVVFRMEEQEFWISTLFAGYTLAWFDKHREGFRVNYSDITEKYHMYAVQGPNSRDMVNALVECPVDEMKFFSFAPNRLDGNPVLINRAGFTGEKLGYEIYIAADQADFLEKKLRETAPAFGAREVTEFQIMAWTLPTEAGFYYMRDLRHCNPLETGLDKGICWDKEFVGKEALLQIREAGPAREMLGFVMEEADVRINGKDQGGPGSPVTVNGEEIGRVSKFNYSYVLEKPVGYILADRGAVRVGDHVTINHLYDAEVTEKRFM